MKKMWKLNNKAVSPVIATILMVAITVVLAAVLYVMVMGFGGGDDNQAPTAVLATPDVDATRVNTTLVSISPETDITDLSYKVGATGNLTALVAGTNFIDLAADGQASSGDYITFSVTGVVDGSILYLIHEPTGDVVDQVEINL